MGFQFTPQQQKALDLNRNIIVTAGAGSGKTTILVERYVRILLHRRVHPAHVLAITFTEKAAAEMKNRVVQRLKAALEDSSFRERAFYLLAHSPQMAISTIHSFCNRVLRQYGNTIGIDPDFLIADELEMADLRQEVFDSFFNQEHLPFNESEFELVIYAVNYFSLSKIQTFFQTVYQRRLALLEPLNRLAQTSPEQLVAHWDALKQEQITQFLNVLSQTELFHHLRTASPPTGTGKTRNQVRELLKLLQEPSSHPGEVFHALKAIFTKSGTVKHHVKTVLREFPGLDDAPLEEVERIVQALGFTILFNTDDTNNQAIDQLARAQIGAAKLLSALLTAIQEEKQSRQLLDFDDLLYLTLDLLKREPSVRDVLQQQYQWILVDEFQDTDRMQAEIIRLLHEPLHPDITPPNLFVVGDPKQGIYGFRNADVRIFQEFEERLQQQNTATIPIITTEGDSLEATEAELRGRIALPHNFRSLPSMVDFFNHCFEPIFERTSPFDVAFQKLEAARATDDPPHISILHLTHEENTQADPAILYQYYLPEIIKQIIQDGKYQFEDIAILLQTRTALSALEEALQYANIPYEVYKGTGFFQKQEILDIFHLLRAVENPHNNMHMWAALRTPYAGISDAVLFILGHLPGGSVWERIEKLLAAAQTNQWTSLPLPSWLTAEALKAVFTPEQQDHLHYFQQQIARLTAQITPHQFSHLIPEILQCFGIRTTLRRTFRGQQKLANIDKLIQFIYDFQQRPGATLSQLIRILENQIRYEEREGEALPYIKGGNRVQIMTIHAAKGLEFPVVIVPNLNQSVNTREEIFEANATLFLNPGQQKEIRKTFIVQWFKFQHDSRLQAEHKRLFYVAATRARDQLYLLSIDGNRNASFSFHTLLWEKAFNQPLDALTPDSLSLPAWVTRNSHIQVTLKTYDPNNIHRATPLANTTPQHQPLSIDTNRAQTYWQFREAKPPQRLFTATQLMLFEENPQQFFQQYFLNRYQLFPPMLELADVDDPEPTGISWGIVAHRVLENFHIRTPEEDLAAIQRVLQEIPVDPHQKSTYEERLLKLLHTFRQHPLATEIQNSPQAYAEFALQLPLDSYYVLMGKLDYIYSRPDGTWAIIDFKTNRLAHTSIPALLKKYALQMEVYALLLQGLVPRQSTIPVGLVFLETMQVEWQTYTPGDLSSTQQRILQLMKQLDAYLQKLLASQPSFE